MRGACGVVYESSCRIIVDAVVECAGYHEHFFRAGRVAIEVREPGADIEFEYQGFGAVRALPEDALANSRKYLLRRNSLPVCRNYIFKVDRRRSPSTDATNVLALERRVWHLGDTNAKAHIDNPMDCQSDKKDSSRIPQHG
jgi:hypothetical protein